MSSFGEGDPRIPSLAQAAHRAALAAGQSTYIDPQGAGLVLTSERLSRVGHCCGSGCRHCPYPAHEQQRAGRASQRPS